MADPNQIRDTIERVVAEVFEARVPAMRAEVIERIVAELQPLSSSVDGAASPAGELEAGVASIEDGSTQAEILRALLEAAAKFTGRVALFVIKNNKASLWQSRGFADDDGIKGTSVDATAGLAARALQDRMPVAAAAVEFDADFIHTVGNPAEGNALLVPMLVRDKTPAIVYADRGTSGRMDTSAVQLLVRAAGHWVELVASRKSGAASGESVSMPTPAAMPMPAAVASAAAAAAGAAPAPETEPPPPPVEAVPEMPPAPVAVAEPEIVIAAGDEEIHKKAKRFAKLLVDEIKLYNQAKVTEGRKSKDLYERLKDDIDKSRATYDKRYGSTPAASANYFSREVVRILADNDPTLLGSNFSH